MKHASFTYCFCLALFVFGVLLQSGCATYGPEAEALRKTWTAGYATEAAKIAAKRVTEVEGSKNELIWRLEEGTALRAAGRFVASTEAFDKAEALIHRFDQEADIKLSKEGIALITHLANLPYKGRYYDRIMISVYKALNALQEGEIEKARVALNRAYYSQREALRANAKRIERAEEEAQKESEKSNGFNLVGIQNSEQVQSQLGEWLQQTLQLATYADYVNPFAVYLDGLYFMYHAADQSDFERSKKSLERVQNMVSEASKLIKEDLKRRKAILRSGSLKKPIVYVFFETGQAPTREEFRIDVPLFLISDDVPYFGATFPRLKIHNNYLGGLSITSSEDNRAYVTQTLCSIDQVVATEFKNAWPVVVTKTLLSSGTKALASYAAKEIVERQAGELWGMLTQIGTSLAQAAINQADLRTWQTLPKEFQVAALPRPRDGQLQLKTANGFFVETVTLPEAEVSCVYARSFGPSTPLQVHTFSLK